MRSEIATLLLIWVGAGGCANHNEDPDGAAVLLAKVTSQGYRAWARAPGHEGRTPGTGPHGGAIDVYVNNVVHDAVVKGQTIAAWPAASLIVKDGFDGDTQ